MSATDTYVNLIGNGESVLTMFEESSKSATDFGAKMDSLATDVTAASDEMGATVDEAGAKMDAAFEASSVSADRVSAAMAEVTAAVEAAAESTEVSAEIAGTAIKGVGVSADETAAQTDTATKAMSVAMARVAASADAMEAQNALALESMAAKTAALSASFAAAEDKAAASNEKLGEAITGTAATTSKASSGIGATFLKTGVVVAGLGGIAVDMASKFQQSTSKLVTSGGELQKNLQGDQAGILALSGQVGDSATSLSAAMYLVTSAGFKSSDALTVLKASAQGAAAEGADLKTVANGLTDILNDYHLKASAAATVTSQMVEATSQGKTSFEDLAGSLSTVVPLAATAGIKIGDLLGVLAQMTSHGVSADEATQQMANTIREFEAPSQVMTAELGQIGLNATKLSQNLGKTGLAGTLQEVEEAVLKNMGKAGTVLLSSFNTSQIAAQKASTAFNGLGKKAQAVATSFADGKMEGGAKSWNAALAGLTQPQANLLNQWKTLQNSSKGFSNALKGGNGDVQTFTQAMQKATGTSSALQVALLTTGANATDTNAKIKAIAGASTEAGNNVKGWSDVQKNLNQRLDEAKSGLEAMAISVGTKLLPPLTSIVSWFARLLTGISANKAVVDAFAIAIGVVLAGGIVGATVKMGLFAASMAKNVVRPIVGAVGFTKNLVGGFQGAETAAGTWGGRMASVMQGVGKAASASWSLISSGAQAAWSGISSVTSTAFTAITTGARAMGTALMETVLPAIGEAAAATWSFTAALLANPITWIVLLVIGLGVAVYELITHWRQVTAFFSKMWKDVKALFMDGVHAVTGFFSDMATRAGEWMNHLYDNVTGWAGKVLTAVGAWIDNLAKTIGNWFASLPGKVWDWLTSTADKMTQAQDQMYKAIGQWVDNIADKIGSWFSSLPGKIWSWMKSTAEKMAEEESNILSDLGHWVENIGSKVVGFFTTTLPDAIGTAFKDAGKWLLNAGSDIIHGLIQGIENAVGALWQGIKDIGSGIVNEFKGVLSIFSPSRVMADEVGQHITRGIAQGMLDSIGWIHAAVGQVAAAVTGGNYGQGSLSLAGIGSLSSSSLSPSASSAGSQGTVVNVTINNAGSVIAQKDLVQTIQTAMAKNGSVNSQTYRPYKR